jgi:hypothetical protein
MRRNQWFLGAALLAFAQYTSAQMQGSQSQSVAACQLPEVLNAWSKPVLSVASVAHRNANDLGGTVQSPYRVQLLACAADWCKPGSFAAMVKIDLPQQGRYRVAVDEMLWIDVLTATQKVEGLLCEHSGCQPIRKIVQYDLKAGPHWIVLESKMPGDSGLLVTKVLATNAN